MTSSELDAKRRCREDPKCHHFFRSESNGGYFKCIGDYQIVFDWPSLLFSKRKKTLTHIRVILIFDYGG